jgi:parallel beta-helix repeat protein
MFLRALMVMMIPLMGLPSSHNVSLRAPADIQGCFPVSGSIQAAIDANPPGTTFCLSGSYRVTQTLRPKQGNVFQSGNSRGSIYGGAPFYFDGAAGPSGVRLTGITISGASDSNIRTGDGWVLDGLDVSRAGHVGVRLVGNAPVVRNSVIHENGTILQRTAFGIAGVKTVNAVVDNNELYGNNVARNRENDDAGALKMSFTKGVRLTNNWVHQNHGMGLWVDNDSLGATVSGNLVENNIADSATGAMAEGIRVEISCYATVSSNTVRGNQKYAQIDVQDSSFNTVSGNTVTVPVGASSKEFAIRIIGEGRQKSGTNCGNFFYTRGNRITGNHIYLGNTVTRVGVVRTAGVVTNNKFQSNDHHTANCSGSQWKWWTGSSNIVVPFSTWRNPYGQDTIGSCSK